MEMLKISPQFCINCPSGQAAANARRGAPGGNTHGNLPQIVTSLTRPVSFYGAMPGFFVLSIDSVGKKYLQILQTQTGAVAETQYPSQSEGLIPVGSTRGILKTNY